MLPPFQRTLALSVLDRSLSRAHSARGQCMQGRLADGEIGKQLIVRATHLAATDRHTASVHGLLQLREARHRPGPFRVPTLVPHYHFITTTVLNRRQAVHNLAPIVYGRSVHHHLLIWYAQQVS